MNGVGTERGGGPSGERLQHDWLRLAEFRDVSVPGWTREAFSDVDVAGRHFVADLMREAGLQVTVDAVGNVIGHLDGMDPSAGLLVTGSHTDTVRGGGRFDGVVGVLGAIETVRVMRESDVALRHSLRIVDFANEEPNLHGLSCVGSRAIVGNLSAAMLALPDGEALPLAERMRRAGWHPDDVAGCRWDPTDVDAYVELHIEQGPVLDELDASVGVVTSIAGIARFVVDLVGRRDHAGTMPMNQRQDASCAAAATILAVERIAAAGSDSVGTVGEIHTSPEAVNVIAEHASISGEFRSPTNEWLDAVVDQLDAAVQEEASRWRTRGRVDWRPVELPVVMDDGISKILAEATSAVGHDAVRLYSGAGHDTVQMARICPTGMLFLPSTGGRSHCPEEDTAFDDVMRGVDVLLHGLVALDAR